MQGFGLNGHFVISAMKNFDGDRLSNPACRTHARNAGIVVRLSGRLLWML